MLNTADLDRLKQAIREASEHAWTDDAHLEDALFPYWLEAIHDIFKTHGCACGTPECLLQKTPDVQRKLPLNALSFPSFVNLFREGRDLFQQELRARGAKA
jgi:hypothetical protein